jgi:hypothetical protein
MLYPAAMAGIGVNYRRAIHEADTLDDLNVTGDFTQQDLARWNNAGVELLTSW